jgi:glycosyltransferase involved in cell wall biosynthesis
MIRALPAVLRAHPNVYYFVVGDGAHRASIQEEAERAGVKARVIFAGMRRDVPRMLAAGDVFVLPSLTEALPTVLAEAMAVRLPLIASRVGGVPEMITHGRNGLIVEPGNVDDLANACSRLLESPASRAEMGSEGWKTVQQKFSIDRQVEQLKDLYLEQIQAYGKS